MSEVYLDPATYQIVEPMARQRAEQMVRDLMAAGVNKSPQMSTHLVNAMATVYLEGFHRGMQFQRQK